jgi:chromosome segregation ATPase
VEDWENKYHYMEQHLEQEVKKMMKVKMDEWVSEKEDVAKVYEELEEVKNRKSEMLRRHTRSMNQQAQENQRLINCIQRMEHDLREKRTEDAEAMLSEKAETPTLKKSVKRLETQNTKLEKETLKLQKQKMEGDVKYLELRTKTDSVIADMKTELEKMKLQVEYYKIKDSVSVHQSPQQSLQPHPQVEEVVLDQG